MCFLTFEDDTGTYETVMFPDLYRERAHLVDYANPYLVTGEVVSDMGSLSLTLHDLALLE
jgi:DNA polymerase III alpha subunit